MLEWLAPVYVFFMAPWFVFMLFFSVLWMEYEEHTKSSILFQGLILFIMYKLSGLVIPTNCIWYSIAAFIPLGLGWATFRWSRYVNYKVDKFKERQRSNYFDGHRSDAEPEYKATVNYKIDMRNQIPLITGWVFSWPLGWVAHLLGDLINLVQTLIKKYFRGVFDRISAKARKRLED